MVSPLEIHCVKKNPLFSPLTFEKEQIMLKKYDNENSIALLGIVIFSLVWQPPPRITSLFLAQGIVYF